MDKQVWDISSLEQLQMAVAEVLKVTGVSRAKGPAHACVLALSGDLGAGKTTFVQTLARQLGVIETVNSPTFVIMKKYDLSADGDFKHLLHIDAYRLEKPEELQILGFDNELMEEDNLICIEWAERVGKLLPSEVIRLEFELTDHKRTLTVKK